MATTPGPPKSPLHNFPITFFQWGSKTPTHPHRSRRRSPSSTTRHPPPPPQPDPDAVPDDNKTWDLRPRKPPPTPTAAPADKLPKLDNITSAERREKRKLRVSLSRAEIEEDIYSFTASKPSRRPRRHPKPLQKLLDNVFPGLWLAGLTPDSYRPLDVPPKR